MARDGKLASAPSHLLNSAGLDVFRRFGRTHVWVAVRPRGTRLALDKTAEISLLGEGEKLMTVKQLRRF